MIEAVTPSDWRDLQVRVARILDEAGLEAAVEQEVALVRGSAVVDVAAVDKTAQPPLRLLCECKHWRSNVPKAVVHSFRTVVADAGAHLGFLISSSGFQSGAREAAYQTNVSLVTWAQFQETFEDRWLEQYMAPRLCEHTGPLIDYTEPLNSRVFRKAEMLSDSAQAEFRRLRQQFQALPLLLAPIYSAGIFSLKEKLTLPLGKGISAEGAPTLPGELLKITAYRDLLEAYIEHLDGAVEQFDEVFGGRA